MLTFLFQVFISASIVSTSMSAFITTVQPHEDDCYFFTVEENNNGTWRFTVEVLEGGFLDIDVSITDPNGKSLEEMQQSSMDMVIPTHKPGTYTYCFSNKMSSLTPKVVQFLVDFTPDAKEDKNVTAADEDLPKNVRTIKYFLYRIAHQNGFISSRQKLHHEIVNNTNSKIVFWSFFEAAILLLMSIGQVYYVKRFFEIKSVV